MKRSPITYFFGSTPDDFDQDVDEHPFELNHDLPNNTYHSVRFNLNVMDLFKIAHFSMSQISPYKLNTDLNSLQIDAVFRIPLFGFKDDVKIILEPDNVGDSILHIYSSSRLGKSDLGVNRRRIQQIVANIKQQISQRYEHTKNVH